MATMGKMSRRKGAAGERELANKLAELLPRLDIKRGIGQSRGGGAEVADVTGLPGIHVECKRQKLPNIRAALRQAEADANDKECAVAMTRSDGDGWLCTMLIEDWALLYGIALTVHGSIGGHGVRGDKHGNGASD